MTIEAASWIGRPVVPGSYELSPLVKLARRARRQGVSFNWVLSEEDLRGLQRAVYEWGSRVSDRYRVFDSRLLTAIMGALDDAHTPCVLPEPSGSAAVADVVHCVREGGSFRLQGHTTFDVLMVYASAGVNPNAHGRAHLTSSVIGTIRGAVGGLGWKIEQLEHESFRGVWNVLYGLPPGYGMSNTSVSVGEPRDVAVGFRGPFSAFDDRPEPCLFTDPLAASNGIYLWTINVSGEERPWYVGQTRRGFGQRIAEHVSGILSGEYTTFDADALATGHLRRLSPADAWPKTLPMILKNHRTLAPHMVGTIRLMRFFVAPLLDDARTLDRIEGAIGRHYKGHAEDVLRKFFYPGLKVPAAIPYEQPLRLNITSDAPLAGMAATLPG